MITRRRLIGGLAAMPLLGGCDRLGENETFRGGLFAAEDAHQALQRTIMARDALAREYPESDMSPVFRTNGTRMPSAPDYQRHLANGFADWRLVVDGLVERPFALSLDRLRALPYRTQITRHDCVEGWSAIGKWHGPQLGALLNHARLKPEARYIVFHCADMYGSRPYYESVDLIDAFHPQTILAWAMNSRPLDVGHGAPVRLRVERQLGYKHAKYVMRVEAVAALAPVYGGKGGLWEDIAGYEWYAGI